MATSSQVLALLIPAGGYTQTGEEFEGIQFLECAPITKKQFENGFAQYDALKAEEEKQSAIKTNLILEKLGITADELKQIIA